MSLDKHQYPQEISHTKKAQALVITLLVLAIISIVVMGVIVVSNRDVNQVITNEKYDRLYNESEKRLIDAVETIGLSSSIDCGSNDTPQVLPAYTQYDCDTIESLSENLTADVDLRIVDKKAIEDFVIKKDRSLDIALNGYTGELQFKWNKAAALEFSIIYTDSSNVVRTIRDIYDLAGTYDSLLGDNPNNDTGNIHDINFSVLDADNVDKSTKFTISSTNGISLGNTISLRVTLRSKLPGDIVSLTVIPGSENSFPLQIREFIASSIDIQDSSSPIASVITKIPLSPQVDDILDYSILVNGNLIQ